MANENSKQPQSGHDPHYPELVGSVHRRPSMEIGSPAIARHLVYWIPQDLTLNREEWVRNIEKLILDLYDNLASERPGQPEAREMKLRQTKLDRPVIISEGGKDYLCLFENRYAANIEDRLIYPDGRSKGKTLSADLRSDTVRFPLLWGKLPLTVEFELHQENFTLSAAIDMSRRNFDGTPDQNARKLNEAFKTLNALGASEGKGHVAEVAAAYRAIYDDIWDRLSVLAKPHFDSTKTGGLIADFKSLVVSKGKKTFIAMPGDGSSDSSQASESFDPRTCSSIVEILSPFIARSGKRYERLEQIFSTLRNGHVVYASTLGQSPAALHREQKALTEVFYATNGDPKQLGETVDLGNWLGASRIAALYDFSRLGGINEKLHKVERKLEGIREGLPDAIRRDGSSDSAVIERVNNDLLQASRDFARSDETIVGGIEHRAERSRRYRKQFYDLLPDQQVKPIGTHWSYDHMVKRRLERDYGFFDVVGERYGRVRDGITGLTRQVQAIESLVLQEQTSKQTEIAAKHQSAIRKIQILGDVFATLFIVPAAIIDVVTKYGGEDTFKDAKPWVKIVTTVGAIATSVAFRVAAEKVFRRGEEPQQRKLPPKPKKDTADYFRYMENKTSSRRVQNSGGASSISADGSDRLTRIQTRVSPISGQPEP